VCGAKRFQALESGVGYLVVDDFDQVFGAPDQITTTAARRRVRLSAVRFRPLE
jgi:hypothetical protein